MTLRATSFVAGFACGAMIFIALQSFGQSHARCAETGWGCAPQELPALGEAPAKDRKAEKEKEMKRACFMLDGDNVRAGINRDLGFGPDDRRENIRRVAEVARLMNDAGLIAITAFISPYRADRDMAREIIGAGRFVEVYLDAPLEVCEGRDPKGLYKKARKGEIPEFTGVSAPYEAPQNADVVLKTGKEDISESVERLLDQLLSRIRK